MTAAADDLRWEAPGPGSWQWQGSHLPGAPTPIYGAVHLHTTRVAMAGLFERYGVPLRTMDEALVNGRVYSSMRPLVGQAGAKPPPKPLLWLAARVHPSFRARTRTARRALADRIWRARTAEWRDTLRPAMRAANLSLQAERLADCDDAALADHVRRAHAQVTAGHLLHFDLHGDDMGPLGMFLCACRDWGIEAGEAIAALTGHSPSTLAAVDALRKVAVAVEASGADPSGATTLDELRALGPGVANALDEYLEEYGWRSVTGYDLDARTVGELPEVLLANVRALPPHGGADLAAVGDAAAAALRARVPAEHRGRFDEVLGEARIALDLRDDNGPITVEWPVGLLRRALLEVGRRAVQRGVLSHADHAVELTLAEVEAILAAAPTVTPAEIAARAAERADAGAVVPPATLGPVEEPPDLSAFPPPLAAVTDYALTCAAHLEKARHVAAARPDGGGGSGGRAGSGLGVGLDPVRGLARVARTPEEALASLAPGEILVVPFTTPAYNAVLAIAAGLVTEEGGALSHAAVLARELDLPAVIGVPGALTSIADGVEVEVDPRAGTVRVLEGQPQA